MQVDQDGSEGDVDFAGLGRGFTGALHVMGRFPSMPATERDDVCQSWLVALRRSDQQSAAAAPVTVRVYRTVSALGHDLKPRVVERRLVHECR